MPIMVCSYFSPSLAGVHSGTPEASIVAAESGSHSPFLQTLMTFNPNISAVSFAPSLAAVHSGWVNSSPKPMLSSKSLIELVSRSPKSKLSRGLIKEELELRVEASSAL